MDNIQNIWNQLTVEKISSTEINLNFRDSIIDNFQKETDLRNKYKPFVLLFLILISVVFFFMVKQAEGPMTFIKFIGVLFIFLSGAAIIYFSQRIKIDLDKIRLDCTATEFIELCSDYLQKARKSYVIGTILQLFSLTVGLYLLIFIDNPDSHIAYKYIFFGFMGGLSGLGIGGSIATFNKHYKGLIDIINKFSNED